MQPFIIFSLPRTGSTTLQQLLNCHPGIQCIFEPFNPTNPRHYATKCDTLRRTHGLPIAVQALWNVCNGFKHVWQWDGWPFPDDRDLNRQLLVEMGAPIILMVRHNRLRRAISGQISGQMQLWTPQTAEDFQRIREHTFRPLDLAELRGDIAGAREGDQWARAELQRVGMPWREVVYEELFSPAVPPEAQVEAVQSVLEFLGVGRVTQNPRLDEMRRLLNPAATGFQNAARYHEIPNIDEIERQLGSDENGHVFDAAR